MSEISLVEVLRFAIALVLALTGWLFKMVWDEIRKLRLYAHDTEGRFGRNETEIKELASDFERTLEVLDKIDERLRIVERRNGIHH